CDTNPLRPGTFPNVVNTVAPDTAIFKEFVVKTKSTLVSVLLELLRSPALVPKYYRAGAPATPRFSPRTTLDRRSHLETPAPCASSLSLSNRMRSSKLVTRSSKLPSQLPELPSLSLRQKTDNTR